MSLLSQQDHPSEVANQDQETMARPFDKHLSLTGSKPASPASSRRATFPSTTAETVSRTMAAPTTPAKDTSQDGNQPVKPNEKQPTSEPKHKTLSRRATFPSTAKTETPPTTPLPAPIENPSQSDVHSDKKNEPQFKGEPMHAILPKLYLGDLRAAENTEELRAKDISFVLTIKEARLPAAVRDAYRLARISQVHIVKADVETEDLLTVFEPVCDMIEGRLAKGKGVLVHCQLGKSRSATVVMAFIMRQMNVTYQEAKVLVLSKRAIVSPNAAFRGQLVVWEKCKFDLRNVRMVGQGTPSDPWAQGYQHKKTGRKVEGEGKAEQKGRGGEKKEVKKGTEGKEGKAKGANGKTDKSKDKKHSKKDEVPKGDREDMHGKAAKSQASDNDQQTQQASRIPATEVVLTTQGAAILNEKEESGRLGGAKENAKDDTFAADHARKDDKPGELRESENNPNSVQSAPPTASEVVRSEQETTIDSTEGEGRDNKTHGAEENHPNKDGKIEESQESVHQQSKHPSTLSATEVGPEKETQRIKDADERKDTEKGRAEDNDPRPLETVHGGNTEKSQLSDSNHPQTDTPSPAPTPEVVRAALKPLCLKYPVMGKKKLLRILNESQGWNIACKEFRAYCEAVVAE